MAIIGAVAVVYQRLPTSFLPSEDQGYIVMNVQLPPAPPGAHLSVMEQIEGQDVLKAARSAEHDQHLGL